MTEGITIRDYKESDYGIVLEWWKRRGWTTFPRELLRPCGVIAQKDFRDIAAAWLYMFPDSVIGLICWYVTNPGNTIYESLEGMKAVSHALTEISRGHGHHIIITTCPEGSLARWFENQGYIRTDSQMVEFIKPYPKAMEVPA